MTNSRPAGTADETAADVDATSGTAPDAAQPSGPAVVDAKGESGSVAAGERAANGTVPGATDEPGRNAPDRTPRDVATGALDAALLADPTAAYGTTPPADDDEAPEPDDAIPAAHLLAIPGPAHPSPSGSDAAWYQPDGQGGWDLMLVPLTGGPARSGRRTARCWR